MSSNDYTLNQLNFDLDHSHDGFYVADVSLYHSGIDVYNSVGDYVESFDAPIDAYYSLCTYGKSVNGGR